MQSRDVAREEGGVFSNCNLQSREGRFESLVRVYLMEQTGSCASLYRACVRKYKNIYEVLKVKYGQHWCELFRTYLFGLKVGMCWNLVSSGTDAISHRMEEQQVDVVMEFQPGVGRPIRASPTDQHSGLAGKAGCTLASGIMIAIKVPVRIRTTELSRHTSQFAPLPVFTSRFRFAPLGAFYYWRKLVHTPVLYGADVFSIREIYSQSRATSSVFETLPRP